MKPPRLISRPLAIHVRRADAWIELAAMSCLANCLQALGRTTIPLPVPVESWIESPLGYRFGISEDERMPPGAEALAWPTLGEILVSESLMANENRYRFTCAHELGHLVLHQHIAGSLVDGEMPVLEDEELRDVEREADRFAAAFLMPVETMAQEFERIRESEGLSPACFELLRGKDLRSLWLWHRVFLPKLMERYQVSRSALVYRCREVRLDHGMRLIMPSLVPLLVVPPRRSGLDLSGVRVDSGVPHVTM